PPDASRAPFPHRSPRTAFNRRSMRRFEASPRRATPKGQTFINCTAPPSPAPPISPVPPPRPIPPRNYFIEPWWYTPATFVLVFPDWTYECPPSVVRRNYLSLFLGPRQERITENTEELREHGEVHQENRSLCSLFCSVHSVIRFLRAAAITVHLRDALH